MSKKPKFRKGQVVRIDTDFYRNERVSQQYQEIVAVWEWEGAGKGIPGFGYTFANGDEANEQYVRGLSKVELYGIKH